MECKAAVIDIDGLAAAKDQLWAEAVYLHFEGKAWWLDTVGLTKEAEAEQSARYEGDPWDELILKWTDKRERRPRSPYHSNRFV